MKEKAALRKEYKTVRDSLGERIPEYSRRICERCAELPEFAEAENVLLYFAKGSEADLKCLFEKAISTGKNVGYPRCVDKKIMVFHKVSDLSELCEGFFGIREPSADAPVCTLGKAVCFVPALAFDKEGYRLGYGGGYYDRFLSDFKGTSVGVAFDRCVTERLPRDEFDIKTDYIITESKVTKTIES